MYCLAGYENHFIVFTRASEADKRISNIQFKEDRLMNINANYGQSQGGRF